MSFGLDIRSKHLAMVSTEPGGPLEPQLATPTRAAIRTGVAARVADYTPEWTSRRPDDAGIALLNVYGTVAEAVNVRLNRIPRRLALEQIELAGVRALHARPALAVLGIEVGERAAAPLDIPEGSAFVAGGGPAPVVIETLQGTTAIPGRLGRVAVLADGWLVEDDAAELGGLAPFGPRPKVPAELWVGIASPIAPAGLLSIAVELVGLPGRATATATATVPPDAPPTLRWEAMTSAGASELPVERDETAALTRSGVLTLRVDAPAPWLASELPGRPGDPPLHWLRARLVTNDFPDTVRLARATLNGVTAIAARSVRDEVLEPVERPPSGRARYRLSQIPVVAGSVLVDVVDAYADPFAAQAPDAAQTSWEEVADLASEDGEARVFMLDAAAGIVTFGDGVHGRAVPDGYRNVVARSYRTGGGSTGLPAAGDSIAAQQSIPDLTGATILTITTGAEAETISELALRGPSQIRSRGRAVAPTDYATLALAAEGVDIARAHCLPGCDPRLPAAPVPGLVGVVVVPQTTTDGPPIPPPDALRAVAEHLAREVGVVGAEVVAAAPRYREIAVHAVLVARAGSDLAATGSAAREIVDGWLHPLTGGDGSGWPFGGTVRWDALSRRLLELLPDALTAVSRLSLRIDGRRLPACTDAPLAPGELTWPGPHLLEVVAEERAS